MFVKQIRVRDTRRMRIIKKKSDTRQTQEELGLLVLLFVFAVTLSQFTPLPGGLLAMALLFILLKAHVVKVRDLSTVTPFLLVHISFFFIPPAVKVIEEATALHGVVLKLILILVISNMLVMGITGRVIQVLLKKEANHE